MSTDVHDVAGPAQTPDGLGLFWGLVALAILAALALPFLPPRALADTTHEIQ